MRHKLFIAVSAALLLVLAACGGPSLKPPDPPSEVTVTPGPGVLHVVWVQNNLRTTGYIIYRAPRSNPAARVKLANVSRDPKNPHYTHIYTDTAASDPGKVLYSVAAVGPGGTSKVTKQTENPTPGLVGGKGGLEKICSGPPTPTDSDGDGIPDKVEKKGWTVKVFVGSASINNTSGTWQQNSKSYTVTSDPHKADTDGDGLCDLQELRNRTDPRNPDTDGDGLSDAAELGTWGSSPTNVDTDKDSFNPTITIKNNTETATINQANSNSAFWDGNEVSNYGTSPTLFDTDGDGYSDYTEVQRGGRFNPLVANLPEVVLSQTPNTTVDLRVNIGYSNSSKKAQAKTTSLQQGQSHSRTDSSSTTDTTWDSVSDTVNESAGIGPKGVSASVGNSTTVASGHSHVKTTGWSKTSTQSSQQTYGEAVSTASEQGRTIQGGSIGIAMDIHNPTPVAYTLSKLTVTALQREHQPDGSVTFDPIATLSFDKALGSGITLGPGKSKTDVIASKDLTAGNVILGLMADPSSLMFTVSNFSLSNQAGVSEGFMEEVADARTAFLTIDYANGDVVRKHVASNVKRKHGHVVGVTLKKALDILGIKYKTTKATDKKTGKTYTVLSQLYDNQAGEWVAVDQKHNKFWTTIVSGGKTAPLDKNFGDIVLQPGEDAFLLFVQDQDHDGLFRRVEDRLGTSDTNPDTDGDGLSDYFEAKVGWDVKPPQKLPIYGTKKHVFSSPTEADADHDGLTDAQECPKGAKDPVKFTGAKPCTGVGTDPDNPDTDNDGLCDGPGSSVNTSGPCQAGAKQDPQPLVPRFALLSESPKPYSFTTAQSASTVSVNFSIPVKASSTFKVRSNFRGRGQMKGSFSFSDGGRTMTFTLAGGKWWIAGEKLTVSLDNIIADATGKKLPTYQYSFRAAANKAGQFNGNSPTREGKPSKTWPSQQAITVGDFNQDGPLDLAFVITHDKPGSSMPEQVVVDLQHRDGSFSKEVYTLAGSNANILRQPDGIVAGDFNNDGRLDLAVTMPTTNQVAVLLAGQTRGTFAISRYYATGPGQDPVSVAAADFNGDGNLDLVTANHEGDNQYALTLLLGNGDGTFRHGKFLPSGPHSSAVATGDFNGDGIPDIITAYLGTGSSYPGGVYINLGNGDGTFRGTGRVQPFRAGAPVAIATGDFNGDGWLDVVTANQDSTVSLLLNDAKGDGVFSVAPNTTVSSNPTAIITGDFNGDGRLDIAVANGPNDGRGNSATVLYGQQNAGVFNRQDLSVEGKVKGRLQAFGLTTILTGSNLDHLNLVLAGSSPGNDYNHGGLVFFPTR